MKEKSLLLLGFAFILFSSCLGEYLDITDLAKVTAQNFSSGAHTAEWSKDGRFLAAGGDDSSYNLKISSFDRNNLNITDQQLLVGSEVFSVDWSVDGKYIAIGTSDTSAAVHIESFDGTALTPITTASAANTARSIKWHPTGSHIAVGEQYVKVYSFNGSSLTSIFSDPFSDKVWSVDWSPDGKYLAAGGNNGFSTNVRIYSFDGTTLTNIISINFEIIALSVNWSPDGKYLAVGGSSTTVFKGLIVYSFNGSTLTEAGYVNIPNYAFAVNWSPDGKYIATYTHVTTTTSKVEIFNFDPQQTAALSLNKICEKLISGKVSSLNWDISGRYIAISNISVTTEDIIIVFINRSLFLKTINTIPEIIYFQNPLYINTETLLSGALKLLGGINILENTKANLDLLYPIYEGADLNQTGEIRLFNDLHLANNFIFTQGGNISGQGYSIILDGDLIIDNNVDLRFTNSTIIDGQGHNVILGHRAQLLIDTLTTLTLKNLTLKNTLNTITQPPVKCLDWYGKLALDNVELALNDDFSFYSGQLFIYNDVVFTGTSEFIYRGVRPSYITEHSTLNFDKGTSFKYYPATTDKTLIKMQDDSSEIYFDGCTLKSTFTGLQLTTGKVYFDNKVNVTTAAILDIPSTPFDPSIGTSSTGNYPLSANWSPDGHFLAITNYYSNILQVFSFNGSGNPSLVGTSLTNTYPHSINWSPDGRFLAVVNSSSYTLQIFSFNGSGDPSLVGTSSTDIWPYSVNWSPNGRFLAVANGSSNTLQVFSFNGSGDPSSVGTSSTGSSPYSVNWSPDGHFLAVVNNSSNTLQVFSFNGSGNPSLVGTSSTGSSPYSVNWSPDGRFLAVANGNSNTLQVFSFNGSGNPSSVGTSSTGSSPLSANWSPDGHFLAVVNYNSNTLQIFSFNGSGSPSLVGTSSTDVRPSSANWSPDGRFLAITNASSDTLQVFTINYAPNLQTQAASNSIVFQDLVNGVEPDATVKIVQGGKVILDGPLNIVKGGISGGFVFNSINGFAMNDDISFAPNAQITKDGSIDGNNHVIFLEDDLNIADESNLIFTGNTVIDGQGHNIILGHRSQLLIDSTATLTLKNLTLKNTLNTIAQPAVKCFDWHGKLALDNVELALNDDFSFYSGQMFIHNDVMFSGTSQFSYRGSQPSYITPQSTFYINKGTTFEYHPSTADKTLIKMQNDSSGLYFDGCTLKSTVTGLQLTTGNVYFSNKVNVISTSLAPSNSIVFQDLVNGVEPDASIYALGGSQIILDGYMKL